MPRIKNWRVNEHTNNSNIYNKNNNTSPPEIVEEVPDDEDFVQLDKLPRSSNKTPVQSSNPEDDNELMQMIRFGSQRGLQRSQRCQPNYNYNYNQNQNQMYQQTPVQSSNNFLGFKPSTLLSIGGLLVMAYLGSRQ